MRRNLLLGELTQELIPQGGDGISSITGSFPEQESQTSVWNVLIVDATLGQGELSRPFRHIFM